VTDRSLSEHERRLRNLGAVAEHLAKEQAAARPAGRLDGRFGAALRRWGPLGVLLALALGKAKWLLVLAKAPLSMVLMVWVYATLWGLPFAAGFVLLIFVHEMGHALVMRQQGIPASAPVFIPFVGAVIAMRGLPRDAWVEAVVALGGPLVGSLGAAGCLAVGVQTGEPFWYALASSGFMINLFNLIPLHPLDGGRIIGAVSRWLWLVGAAIGVAVFLVTWSPMMFLLLLFGLLNLGELRRPPREDYYRIPPARRLAIGAAYVGLVVVLVFASWWTDGALSGQGLLDGAITGT
jgi:Zn-dependent protease